ncbi:MAG: hypothetical protein KF681_09650 [Bdellovibrionaceae bacterium]|nr:hypothetical protein [Pseudobdellovibrionaceae bacterium]
MKSLLLLTTLMLFCTIGHADSEGDPCTADDHVDAGTYVCRNGRLVFQAAGTTTPSGTQTPASANQTPASTATSEQVDAVTRAIAACETAAESTVGSCATDRNGSMGGILDGADALARGLAQMNAGTGTTSAETCQTMAQTAGAANTAMGAIKANCLMSFNSCSSSCKEAEDAIKQLPAGDRSTYTSQLSGHKTKCNSAQTRLKSLDQNIAGALQAYQRSQTCVQDTTGNQLPTLEQCRANPALPNCNLVLPQDCTNPQVASTNIACICQASNGRDSRCGQANLGSTSPYQGPAGGTDKGSINDGTLGAQTLDAFGTKSNYEMPSITPTEKINSQLPGSPGGGGMGGGSGRGANEPKPRQAAYYPSRINAEVNKGFVGGSGAPGAFKNGQALNGGTVSPDGGWIPPKVAPNPNEINFDRFRPSDAAFKNRGLASNDVLPNGLLAPHVNIWKQVNSRYQKIMSTLTP